MSDEGTTTERLRYRLDNFLAKGSGALFLSLVIAFLGAIVTMAVIRYALNLATPEGAPDLDRQLWVIFLQLTDPGNMAQDNDTPTIFKVSAVLAGMTGVVIFSALIAFLTTALDQAIGHLRRGHSRVLESGHTLILGWSPRVVEILNELIIANESEEDAVVVVLADEDKEAMDEHLRTHFKDRRTTRVVTRSGSTASLPNLAHVSVNQARSAIVLANCAPEVTKERKLVSDAHVVKSSLALRAKVGANSKINIVAEIFDQRNRPIIESMATGRAAVVDAEEILAKIIVQTSRTSGLALVYSELLSFAGCEMYFHRAAWKGATFGEIQLRFHDGVPIGMRKADGTLLIRPSPDTKINNDDEILIVAQDDSSIRLESAPVVKAKAYTPPDTRIEQRKERMLIIGWGSKAPTIISEYADYVLAGSCVDVMFQAPPAFVRDQIARLDAELDNLNVRHVDKLPLDSGDLASVDPFSYDTILILQQSVEGDLDAERADAESIVVLLHLRKLAAEHEAEEDHDTKIITEVLDSANQELVAEAGVNDFVISNRLVSMFFAQLSEEPRLQQVYDDLFAEEGSEIYVKPASLYFDKLPVECTFGELMLVAQKRDGEVCIGYKCKADERNAEKRYGVRLVPPKDTKLKLSKNDALVVVAADER